METTTDGQRPGTSDVKTVLQYLVRTHRQLLVFYGSAFTVGSATNRPLIAGAALVMAGLPHLCMIVLAVVDRDALKALGSDYSQPGPDQQPETPSRMATEETDDQSSRLLPIKDQADGRDHGDHNDGLDNAT
jgi:hypothetical protein